MGGDDAIDYPEHLARDYGATAEQVTHLKRQAEYPRQLLLHRLKAPTVAALLHAIRKNTRHKRDILWMVILKNWFELPPLIF